MTYYCPACGSPDRAGARFSPMGPQRPTKCRSRRCTFDPADGAVFLTKAEFDLREELETEAAFVFRRGVSSAGVPISRTTYSTTGYRTQIQVRGALHKCHTCRTDAATDTDQPWVGDHVPSTKLSAKMQAEVRAAKSIPTGKTYLFPHCFECSNKQAQAVKAHASATSLAAVPAADQPYLLGTMSVSAANCIEATGPKVTAAQGREIQRIGVANGCHCCGTRFPAPYYIADHVFPKEMCTAYMEGLFKKLGLQYPVRFYLMAQCVKCSTNQGGTLSGLALRAQAMARKLGVKVYK